MLRTILSQHGWTIQCTRRFQHDLLYLGRHESPNSISTAAVRFLVPSLSVQVSITKSSTQSCSDLNGIETHVQIVPVEPVTPASSLLQLGRGAMTDHPESRNRCRAPYMTKPIAILKTTLESTVIEHDSFRALLEVEARYLSASTDCSAVKIMFTDPMHAE